MQLKDFVSESLTQIVEGVRDAQSRTADMGCRISPTGLQTGSTALSEGSVDPETGDLAEVVEFDIAVTAEDSHGEKGGIGVLAAALTLGGSVQSQEVDKTVSRLKFGVSILLPTS